MMEQFIVPPKHGLSDELLDWRARWGRRRLQGRLAHAAREISIRGSRIMTAVEMRRG